VEELKNLKPITDIPEININTLDVHPMLAFANNTIGVAFSRADQAMDLISETPFFDNLSVRVIRHYGKLIFV
jgi:hypothetical protein